MNKFVNSHLPKHSDFTFTKNLDPATPRLAHACSAQSLYPFAAFFFRRRIGIGIGGIRFPFMVMGMTKVRIQSWELGADLTETVKLNYASVGWSTLRTEADTNLPTDMVSKGWDTEANTENNKLGRLFQALSAGLTAIAGAATAIGSTAHDVAEEEGSQAATDDAGKH